MLKLLDSEQLMLVVELAVIVESTSLYDAPKADTPLNEALTVAQLAVVPSVVRYFPLLPVWLGRAADAALCHVGAELDPLLVST